MTPNEIVTQRLTGNGLVIERTEKNGGSAPWWWISDERRVSKAHSQTYARRELLKTNGCRWSNKRRSWYYIGTQIPAEIATLVGSTAPGEPIGQPNRPVPPSSRYSPTAEAYQARVLRRFAEQFQADLERLTRYPALPAIATIRLDDPWA